MTAPSGRAVTRKSLVTEGIGPWLIGLAVGGLATFALLLAANRLVPSIPAWVTVAVCLVTFLASSGAFGIHLEGSKWRIPRGWGAKGVAWHSFTFGVGLGTGFLTALPSPAAYVVVFALIDQHSAAVVGLTVIAFELGRASMTVPAAWGAFIRAKGVEHSLLGNRVRMYTVNVARIESIEAGAIATVALWILLR